MKLTLFFIAFTTLFACGHTKKIKGDGTGQTLKMKPSKEIPAAALGFAKDVMGQVQPLTIEKVTIEGNTIALEVSYSGGCIENTFAFEGSHVISKSLPAIRGCRLVRKGEADSCKALVKRALKFDISELAYKKEAGNEIILTIEGWEGRLSYIHI